jgi:hypothetical protein
MTQSHVTNSMTYYDGVSKDQVPWYIKLDGTNGIKAPIDTRTGNLDYILMMWFRP